MLDVHHRLPVAAALTTSQYAAPMVPDDARRLFEAACISIGVGTDPQLPLRPGRGFGSVLLLSKEWEMTEIEERITAAIEASYEPTWDAAAGEFTWGMGLNEPHPRGQYNAFLAAAEAGGPGAWAALSARPVAAGPKVVGVDFPAVALSEAVWRDDQLHLTVAPLRPDRSSTTTFQVTGLSPGRSWEVRAAGAAASSVTVEPVPGGRADTGTLTVTVPVDALSFQIIVAS